MFDFLRKLFGLPDIPAIMDQGAVIIDVRTPQEFKSGHPGKAVNIPLASLNKSIKKVKKYKKPIITCCMSGRRSGVAAKMLKDYGIEAYNGGPWTRVARVAAKK